MSNGEGRLGLRQGMVRLSNPTPRWAELFGEEAARLRAALSEFKAVVEHVGSTSIPAIPAKPILDILIGIPHPLDLASIRNALTPIGYEHATWAGVPGNEVFGKGDPRTHIAHVVPLHEEAWIRMIGFRDALRIDAVLASEYAALKCKLAAQHPHDRAVYTDGKSAFVERVLAGE